MLLYHGTTATVARLAARDGLKPRSMTGRSNYTAASNPDGVYLTDAYAPYFAFNTRDPNFTEGCAVLVIDTNKIGPLYADEDALEQASRVSGRMTHRTELADLIHSVNPNVERWDMAQRTRWYRNRSRMLASKGFDGAWSLATLGTCWHHGTIPPDAIVKLIEWHDRNTILDLALIFDPLITVANYQFCGADYRYLLQEFARVDTGHSAPFSFTARPGYLDAVREVFNRVTIHEMEHV